MSHIVESLVKKGLKAANQYSVLDEDGGTEVMDQVVDILDGILSDLSHPAIRCHLDEYRNALGKLRLKFKSVYAPPPANEPPPSPKDEGLDHLDQIAKARRSE